MKEHYLNNLLDYLQLNAKQFSESLKFDRVDRVYNVLNFKNGLSNSLAKIITNNYPFVNYDWLLTGEGEMLNKTEKELKTNYSNVHKSNSPQNVIRYWPNVEVTGGGILLFEDALNEKFEDMIIPEFRDCTDAVNLYGDSMSPKYNPGQIIILKEWKDTFIAFGQVYLVITKSGFRTVKYLRKSDKNNEVICVSENTKYDSFNIELDDILKLYLVKGAIEKTTL